MSRECFAFLCEKIKTNIGEHEFKSEEYLRNYGSEKAGNDAYSPKMRWRKVSAAHTGGFISGEIKLALTLRLLDGGSYLDLSLLFETSQTYAFKIFYNGIENWILDDKLIKINGLDYVIYQQMMSEVARCFAEESNGVINGCIGALDGWIVKCKIPIKTRDRVRDPSSFYS